MKTYKYGKKKNNENEGTDGEEDEESEEEDEVGESDAVFDVAPRLDVLDVGPRRGVRSLRCKCECKVVVQRNTEMQQSKWVLVALELEHTGGCIPSPEQLQVGLRASGRRTKQLYYRNEAAMAEFARLSKLRSGNQSWNSLSADFGLKLDSKQMYRLKVVASKVAQEKVNIINAYLLTYM